jgi:hypothetical protein
MCGRKSPRSWERDIGVAGEGVSVSLNHDRLWVLQMFPETCLESKDKSLDDKCPPGYTDNSNIGGYIDTC